MRGSPSPSARTAGPLHSTAAGALGALLTVAVPACGSFNGLAAQIARGQLGGTLILRKEGTLGFDLCRRYAAYTYFEELLTASLPESQLPSPPPFVTWYSTPSVRTGLQVRGGPIAWSTYCATLDQTGEIYNAGIVALAGYSTAIQALATGEKFDGTPLSTIGSGVASLSNTLGAPSAVSSAATSIGSSTSSLAGPIVTYVRTRELKKLLTASASSANCALRSFDAYLIALEDLRTLVSNERRVALAVAGVAPTVGGALSPAVQGLQAYDLASDSQTFLDRVARRLTSDRFLLNSMTQAETALLLAARTDGNQETQNAASTLSNALVTLGTHRPEDP